LVLVYHGIPAAHNELLFSTESHTVALISALTSITTLTPNLKYFGINFYTPSLPIITASTTTDDKDNFQDLLFLSQAFTKLVDSHPKLEHCDLWLDGGVAHRMDWSRDKRNVKKAMARDLRRGFAKIGVAELA